jgi:uncharacterized protein (TIGR03382 family)
MLRAISICGAIVLPAAFAAADVVNGDFEAGPQDFSLITGWEGGGTADHASFGVANTGAVTPVPLGALFGFYDAGFDNSIHQQLPDLFDAGASYSFGSWAVPGTNMTGAVNYQLGYFTDPANELGFVELASFVQDLDGSSEWTPYPGVSIDGAALPSGAIGQQVVLRFGSSGRGAGNDVWVDSVTFVPAPAAATLLGMAGVVLVRRRR